MEPTQVRDILTHSTGLQHAFPDKPTFNNISDWGKMQRVLEEAAPAWPPGSRASYHYFTFGWLVAAVVEKASGVPFEEARTEDRGQESITYTLVACFVRGGRLFDPAADVSVAAGESGRTNESF